MSIDTNTSTIPSRTLELTFRAARLPLTAVETVTRRRGTDWPPAIAFTRVEGAMFQVAAGVLNDDALAAEGKRLQAAAIKAVADATAEAIEKIAASTEKPGGATAVQLKVAEKAVDAFGSLARTTNAMIVPADLSGVSGLLASAMGVMKGVPALKAGAVDIPAA